MNELPTILTALNSDSAKTRERAIKDLAPTVLSEPQIIDALQKIVSADPVEYVREAARARLLESGQTPAASVAPIQVKQEGAGKPAIFAFGVVGAALVICICVALAVIAALAMFNS